MKTDTSGFESLMRGLKQVAEHQAGTAEFPVNKLVVPVQPEGDRAEHTVEKVAQ